MKIRNLFFTLFITLTLTTTIIKAEETTGTLKEAEDFVEILLRGIEENFRNSLIPIYQKIRADPTLSKVTFAVLVLVFFNLFVVNLLSCLCCGCSKVI